MANGWQETLKVLQDQMLEENGIISTVGVYTKLPASPLYLVRVFLDVKGAERFIKEVLEPELEALQKLVIFKEEWTRLDGTRQYNILYGKEEEYYKQVRKNNFIRHPETTWRTELVQISA